MSISFSLNKAIELGKLITIMYAKFESKNPESVSLPEEYTLISNIYGNDINNDIPNYQLFGFIAKKEKDIFVIIRGTETILEWILDTLFVLEPFPYIPNVGNTEQGFTQLYTSLKVEKYSKERLIDTLQKIINKDIENVYISGHSLGAAVATLLSFELVAKSVFLTPCVYTFGSPAVGDKVFVDNYNNLITNNWRVVNLNDIITSLPPSWVGYTHVNNEYQINSNQATVHGIECWHSIYTYLHTLNPTVSKLLSGCNPQNNLRNSRKLKFSP